MSLWREKRYFCFALSAPLADWQFSKDWHVKNRGKILDTQTKCAITFAVVGLSTNKNTVLVCNTYRIRCVNFKQFDPRWAKLNSFKVYRKIQNFSSSALICITNKQCKHWMGMSTLHEKKRFLVASHIFYQDVFSTLRVRAIQPILSKSVKFGRNRPVSCSATLILYHLLNYMISSLI